MRGGFSARFSCCAFTRILTRAAHPDRSQRLPRAAPIRRAAPSGSSASSGVRMSATRQLHGHILTRIELALGQRPWSWLAREAGVPQSTLVSQAAKPKFSVEVLLRIAMALDRPITYFLPACGANDVVKRAADDALAQIEDIIARARDLAS